MVLARTNSGGVIFIAYQGPNDGGWYFPEEHCERKRLPPFLGHWTSVPEFSDANVERDEDYFLGEGI